LSSAIPPCFKRPPPPPRPAPRILAPPPPPYAIFYPAPFFFFYSLRPQPFFFFFFCRASPAVASPDLGPPRLPIFFFFSLDVCFVFFSFCFSPPRHLTISSLCLSQFKKKVFKSDIRHYHIDRHSLVVSRSFLVSPFRSAQLRRKQSSNSLTRFSLAPQDPVHLLPSPRSGLLFCMTSKSLFAPPVSSVVYCTYKHYFPVLFAHGTNISFCPFFGGPAFWCCASPFLFALHFFFFDGFSFPQVYTP